MLTFPGFIERVVLGALLPVAMLTAYLFYAHGVSFIGDRSDLIGAFIVVLIISTVYGIPFLLVSILLEVIQRRVGSKISMSLISGLFGVISTFVIFIFTDHIAEGDVDPLVLVVVFMAFLITAVITKKTVYERSDSKVV